jgi:hypothetical protein
MVRARRDPESVPCLAMGGILKAWGRLEEALELLKKHYPSHQHERRSLKTAVEAHPAWQRERYHIGFCTLVFWETRG